MSEPEFNAEQSERVRVAGRELLQKLGLSKLAGELSISPMALMSVLSGSKHVTRAIAEGIARLSAVSLDQLVGASSKSDRYPNRTEAIAAARKEGYSGEAIAAVESRTPPEDLSVTDWLFAIHTAHESKVAPPPEPSTPATEVGRTALEEPASLVTPPTVVDPPQTESKSTTKRDPNAPLRTTLEMIDAAAISMGLDLFPRRHEEIFREYGLTLDDGEREMAAWREHLEKHPRDRATWQSMREGSRNSWLRAEREKSGQSLAATKPSLDLLPAPPPLPVAPIAPPVAPSYEAPPAIRSTLGTGHAPEAPPTMPDVAPPAPPAAAKKIVDPTVHFTGQDVFAALSAEPPPPPPPPTQAAPPPTVVEAPPTIQPERRAQKHDDRTMVLTKVDSPPVANQPAPTPAPAPRKKFDEATMKHVANAPRQKSKYDDETMRALQPIAPIAPIAPITPEPAKPNRAPIDPTIAMPPEADDAKKRK